MFCGATVSDLAPYRKAWQRSCHKVMMATDEDYSTYLVYASPRSQQTSPAPAEGLQSYMFSVTEPSHVCVGKPRRNLGSGSTAVNRSL